MTKSSAGTGRHDDEGRLPHRVRLPGFITTEDIGLGEVIKRATSYLGIQPCDSCGRRAHALNRRVVFTTRTSRENRT